MRLQEMSCMDCVVINRGMSVTKNNRAKGSIYEEKIAAFLKQSGFVILERNYRCKQGDRCLRNLPVWYAVSRCRHGKS